MQRLTILLILVGAGCSASRQRAGDAPADQLRLCVENATSGYGSVNAQANSVRFTVQPGETVCRSIGFASAAVRLHAVTTGGGMSGPLSFATGLDPVHTRCWRWRLVNGRGSDLTPCE